MGEKPKAPKGCYWRGEILWGRFEVSGTEVRRSLHTDDEKIAEGRLKTLKQEETAARRFGDRRVTWADAVVGWSTAIGGHAKPNTVKRYAVSLRQMEPYLIGLFVDEINKAVVNDIVRRRRTSGTTNATIRRDLVALSSVLSFCEDEDWIADNPALSKMKRIKERRDPIVLPEARDIEAVIERAPGTFGALIRTAWLTGCRQDELRKLERQHLDFGRGQITIYLTKTGRARVIEMKEARPVLAKVPTALRSKVVFWHTAGEPYLNIASNFRRLVAAARKSAQRDKREFRPFRFHDLRHRFAVDWLKNGGGIYDLSQHLGHTSVKTTEIYLAYLTAEEKVAAMKGSAQNPAHEQRFVLDEKGAKP